MKHKIILLATSVLVAILLVGCRNNSASNTDSNSSKTTKVSKKVTSKNLKKKQNNNIQSSSSNSNSSDIHLTGGQSTIDYLNKVKGNQGWVIDSGTYGGAHGAPTSSNYVPYNRVHNADGTKWYYVYSNGKIVEDSDMEQNGDQINSSSDSQDANVSNNDEDND